MQFIFSKPIVVRVWHFSIIIDYFSTEVSVFKTPMGDHNAVIKNVIVSVLLAK